MPELTMGSLFDGIGGFPLAAIRNGITPVWASEIEAFPHRSHKNTLPRHGSCRGYHKAQRCGTAARGHHLRGQSVSGLLGCVRDTRRIAGRAFRTVF